MKKIIFSNHTPKKAIDWTSLLLRLGLGLFMMLNHGWMKLSQFDQMSGKFVQFMGLSSSTSLSLAIFAEFFCSFLLNLRFVYPLGHYPLAHCDGDGIESKELAIHWRRE